MAGLGVSENRQKLYSLLSNAYVKRCYGYGAQPENSRETAAAVDAALKGPTQGVGAFTTETWLVQDRVSISEEFRVHSIEESVVNDLTYDRHSGHLADSNGAAANRFVSDLLGRLPDTLVARSVCGWDVALTGQDFVVIEVNFAGFHHSAPEGFQGSGFLAEPIWGPLAFARLLRFIESEYHTKFEVHLTSTQHPEVDYMYWWIAQWRGVLAVADRIAELASNVDGEDKCCIATSAMSKYSQATKALQQISTSTRRLTAEFERRSQG